MRRANASWLVSNPLSSRIRRPTLSHWINPPLRPDDLVDVFISIEL